MKSRPRIPTLEQADRDAAYYDRIYTTQSSRHCYINYGLNRTSLRCTVSTTARATCPGGMPRKELPASPPASTVVNLPSSIVSTFGGNLPGSKESAQQYSHSCGVDKIIFVTGAGVARQNNSTKQ